MPSLRSSAAYRIAFTYAAAFAAAILLLGVAVYFAADAEFRHQRDQAISEELANLARERSPAALVAEIAEREAHRATDSFGYAVFDRGGKRIAGSLDTARPALGFGMIVFHDPQEGPDLARAEAVDLANGDRLVVAVDSETVEAIDATILELFGGAFVIVVAVGTLGAVLLARYLRQRLGAISTTANAIVAADLGRRMPVSPVGDEFDDVASALNAMLDRIAGLMENIRQVSSDVAHDLRTPLLRLRGQLERVGRVDGAAQRAIELGDELLKLFASILRIAEIESGSLDRTFARIDLTELTNEVGADFLPAVVDGGRTLTWKAERDVTINGERGLVAQALANLIDNAIAHTPLETQIDLSLSADRGWAIISVADDGPGVSLAEESKLLRRFYRAEASRTTPGNGLGLTLVAAVAATHGGEVVIASERPGLRVTIRLPRAT